MRIRLILKLCFWLFITSIDVSAQSTDSLNQKGEEFFRRDQIDSSFYYHRLAFADEDLDVKLQALGSLIKLYTAQSKLDSAKILVDQGDAIASNNMVDIGTICHFKTMKAEYLKKNSQFEEALEIHQDLISLSKTPGVDSSHYANALFYTGMTFEKLLQYDSAVFYVEKAHDLYRVIFDTTTYKFSNIYNSLGVCYYRSGDLDLAEKYYLKAIDVSKDQVGLSTSDIANCYGNLGAIYTGREEYQKAISSHQQALRIYSSLGDEYGKSFCYYGIGTNHYYLGDYGRTKDYMEACIDIRKGLFGRQHHSLINPMELLGIAYEEAGFFDRTLLFYNEVRPLIDSSYGSRSIYLGYNLENTAICFNRLNQLDSSLKYISLSNDILESQLSEHDHSLANHLYTCSDIYFNSGLITEAMSYIDKSIEASSIIGDSVSENYALSLTLQAVILGEQQKWSDAEKQLKKALHIINLDPDSPEDQLIQPSPSALSVLNSYLEFLYNKYLIIKSDEDLLRFEKTANFYLTLSESFRQQFIDPYTLSVLIKDNARVYQRIIGIYNQLYQSAKNEDYVKAAYKFSEYSRTSMLRDLQGDKIASYAGVPDSLLCKETSIKKQISDYGNQILETPDDSGLKQELFKLKEQLNEHIEITRQSYPRYYDVKFKSTVPDLQKVQESLESNQSIIEFMRDDSSYYAILITHNKSELFQIANCDAVNDNLQQWLQSNAKVDMAENIRTAQLLYSQLWQPLASEIEGDHITIIPDGELFYLSFESLMKGSSPKDFLIHDYEINYALSIAVLISDDVERHAENILAIAPGFENDLKSQYANNLDSVDLLDENYLNTLRQPWSVKLAQDLKSKFGVNTYVGVDANEQNIKSNIHRGKILYFGTHGITDAIEPLQSKLILSKDIGEQKEDGYLHAYELFSLPLQADLAVLNACESGLGSIQSGEGMISLAYGMHYAGCPSTVMSLWKIDEKISTVITGAFIDNLSEEQSMGAALRQSKLDYLAQAGVQGQHPFYWSGMVLMGKDQVVDLEHVVHYHWIFLIVIVLLIAIFIWWKSLS